jgi:hypothetical protein
MFPCINVAERHCVLVSPLLGDELTFDIHSLVENGDLVGLTRLILSEDLSVFTYAFEPSSEETFCLSGACHLGRDSFTVDFIGSKPTVSDLLRVRLLVEVKLLARDRSNDH